MINTLPRLSDQLEKAKLELEQFYSKYLHLKLDLYDNFLPVQQSKNKSLGKFEFIPHSVSEDYFIGIYEEIYGKDSVLYDYYCKGTLFKSIKEAQERPSGSYLISHFGNPLPDVLNKSATDVKEGFVLMTPKEGIVSALRLRVNEGCILDPSGSTHFFAKDIFGNLMRMSGYNGYFSIRACDECNKHESSGWRKVQIH
ncbi:MAG: hypothetical protein KBC44_03375 [Candidatus Pacebacteria bacterium]|nr:hypothetical protein [Candidatus Paceibacterota bacterium]MBP9839987.1 hypothetical protein [Candidatus Paceibacterota bacterium]MDQ5922303.1 hypothetical protein [Patescibacteria group bacterium]